MAAFRTFWNSPVGPKTTHFWGPIANFSFVIAGVADTQKPPDMISGNMTAVMCGYSGLFMRFAWVVQPRNYLLMACHASNETVQLYQLSRWASAHGLDTSHLNDLVYVYYNLRLWVKQLEIKIDAKAISLDEIDTTAAWRGEVEEPVIETALDWLEDSSDDHGISEDLDQDVSEDIQFHAESASVPPPERESQSEGDRPSGSTSSRPPLPVPSSRGHLSRGSSTSRGRLTPVRGAHASRAPTPTARGKAVSTAITFARKKGRGNP